MKAPSGKFGTIGRTYCNEFNLVRQLLNLKVLPTSKALKLYTTLSSTSMTNCFAMMFKQKLDKCMMICDDCLRRFNENVITLAFNIKHKKFMHSRQ